MDTNHKNRRSDGVAENTHQGIATDSAGMREQTRGGAAGLLPPPFLLIDGTPIIPATGENTIPDALFEELKAVINQTIHELVFTCEHLEHDRLQEADETMMTVEGNIEQLRERMAKFDPYA